MKRKDPLLRAAIKLQRCLVAPPSRTVSNLHQTTVPVLRQADLFTRALRGSLKAEAHGWPAAADHMTARATDALRQLSHAASLASGQMEARPCNVHPPLSDLYGELLQLQQEFEQSNVDSQHQVLSVTTAAIELEGIYLGPFRIELHFERLVKHADASAFDIVALDPHPASNSEDTTHPHVRDRQICAGDATNPIAQSLHHGRICDAFLSVHAVLQHYNSDSPYVSLDGWNGVSCGDCGTSVDASDLSYCEDCGGEFCDDCSGCCDLCERSCCTGCQERDAESHRMCCRRCHHTCARCNRIVDANNFDGDSGYCPACLENFLCEQEDQIIEPQTQTEELNHGHENRGLSRPERVEFSTAYSPG